MANSFGPIRSRLICAAFPPYKSSSYNARSDWSKTIYHFSNDTLTHLSEKLFKVVEYHLWMSAEAGQGGVITHRTKGFISEGRKRFTFLFCILLPEKPFHRAWIKYVQYCTYLSIPSCAVAVPYFPVAVTIRCDWMRRTKTMGSHFNVTACHTVYVVYLIQYCKFPTHTKSARLQVDRSRSFYFPRSLPVFS
jgi:hypothetical protein